MMMTATDIRYLHTLITRPVLPIVTRCPECGDQMPERYLDLLRWSEIHTVIDIRPEGSPWCRPTLVIGCEGYHIMNSDGTEKNHGID